jgi:hypothetical protein
MSQMQCDRIDDRSVANHETGHFEPTLQPNLIQETSR